MPVYEHLCDACQHEWEDEYSIKIDPPSTCPECKVTGQVKRLISLCAPGRVELGRHEMKEKIKEDVRKLKSDANKNENLLANLVGEDKYQNNKVLEKKVAEVRPKIKTSRKKSVR